MDLQLTIRKRVAAEGIGLHSGRPSKITLSPAPADSGIVFRCADPHRTLIPARPEAVVDSRFATTLGVNGTRVRTVEHLMAAADPGNAGWQRDLSVSQDNIGNVLSAQGDLSAALAASRHRVGTVVKAATFHELQISQASGRWEIRVILDI